jgi:3-mercaptopyruvate sulfurtransferase SseA
LEGGAIPGSLNLPFTAIVKDDGITSFKSESEIRLAFEEAGVVLDNGGRVVLTCGSGLEM